MRVSMTRFDVPRTEQVGTPRMTLPALLHTT